MTREQLEELLNSFIGKRIAVKMNSDYCSCITCMQLKSIEFSEGVRKSRVSSSFIKYSNVSISDEKGRVVIEYEDVENIKYKDIDRGQFYEFQLIYRDGAKVQFYSEEAF